MELLKRFESKNWFVFRSEFVRDSGSGYEEGTIPYILYMHYKSWMSLQKKKNPQPSQCQNENCDADRFVKPHHHFNYWKCLRVKARDHPKYDVFGASSPDHACSSAGLHFVTHHNFSKAYRWDSSHESGLKVTSMFSSMTRSYRHIGGLEKMEDIAWGYFIPRANFIYTPFLSNSVKHFKKKIKKK